MYIINFLKKILPTLIILFFGATLLILSLRGLPGNPNIKDLNSPRWIEQGPFELSPEKGRFALMYSLVEDHSFQFSNDIGKFAEPDVAVSNGKYVSLFAPLLSFVAIPGYVIGKYFNISQVGAFAIISIFALLNFILLRLIAIRLGANNIAATLASLVFLFGTPAFAYAVNLYQHHISTFLILLSIYALLKSKKAWSLIITFLLCATAISLDYPNLFFMFPIGIFALGRIVSFENIRNNLSIKLNLFKFLTLLVMIIPIIFFLWFNQASYGNPFQLSGTLQTTRDMQNPKDLPAIQAAKTLKEETNPKNAVGFFKTRGLVNGLYIHFISPDRGVIYYAPVVLFGIIGFILALKKKVPMVPLLSAIIGVDILLYSMWLDPWGGWAFGSRYLIPSYAILSIFIALLLTYWRKNLIFITAFLIVFSYSVAVNTLGAITSSANPPQVEVLELEKLSGKIQKYTFERNWDYLITNNSKSFVFQTWAKNYLSAVQYYQIIIGLIIAVSGSLLAYGQFSKRRDDD